MLNNRKQKFKRKKGAALLVAILLSAIIGSAALGVSAVALRQVSISETYSNGLAAYYASESGLEEGLLRYKFNKDIEVPQNINDNTSDSATLGRTPNNAYRNFMDEAVDMRKTNSLNGVTLGYAGRDREQVYDLQTFFKQKYFGEDNNGNGIIESSDIAAYPLTSVYRIDKDESKVFTIVQTANPNDNKITLYWQWIKNRTTAACNGLPRAVEIKLKTKEINPISKKNEFTMIFRDPRAGCSAIANSINATSNGSGVYSVSTDAEVKAQMGISALTVTEMTIKPVGNTANSGDGILLGFNQGPAAKTTGPSTTIRSVGYFAGASKEIVANIDRQTGTILDLFQYVIYKGN